MHLQTGIILNLYTHLDLVGKGVLKSKLRITVQRLARSNWLVIMSIFLSTWHIDKGKAPCWDNYIFHLCCGPRAQFHRFRLLWQFRPHTQSLRIFFLFWNDLHRMRHVFSKGEGGVALTVQGGHRDGDFTRTWRRCTVGVQTSQRVEHHEFGNSRTDSRSESWRGGGCGSCKREEGVEGEGQSWLWYGYVDGASVSSCISDMTPPLGCILQGAMGDHVHREDLRKVWKECQEESFWYRGESFPALLLTHLLFRV